MANAKNKTVENKGNVNDFLNSIEKEVRRNDAFELLGIFKTIINEPPKMWGNSIVGYGKYHYKYDSGREGDFMKIGFSPRKQNMTIYFMNGFNAYQGLLAKLGKHKTSKACLYFNKLADIDITVLKEILTHSYNYMNVKYG